MRITSLPRTSRGAGVALAERPLPAGVQLIGERGLACGPGPCNAPSLRSPWPGGCASTPDPAPGGIIRCKLRSALGRGTLCSAAREPCAAIRPREASSTACSSGITARTHYLRFGGSWEGWDADRAEADAGSRCRRSIAASGARRSAGTDRSAASLSTPRSFRLVASEWLHRQLVQRVTRRAPQDQPRPSGSSAAWRSGCFGPVPADEMRFAHAEDLCVDSLPSVWRSSVPAGSARRWWRIIDPRTGRHQASPAQALELVDPQGGRRGAACPADAAKRGAIDAVPDLRSAAPKAERPKRCIWKCTRSRPCCTLATLLEDEHRGLTWGDDPLYPRLERYRR